MSRDPVNPGTQTKTALDLEVLVGLWGLEADR